MHKYITAHENKTDSNVKEVIENINGMPFFGDATIENVNIMEEPGSDAEKNEENHAPQNTTTTTQDHKEEEPDKKQEEKPAEEEKQIAYLREIYRSIRDIY